MKSAAKNERFGKPENSFYTDPLLLSGMSVASVEMGGECDVNLRPVD